MIVFRAGESLGKKSLGGVLRHRWDSNRAEILRRIKRREAKGVPLVDEMSGAPLEDPGEWMGDPELDGVIIEPRALTVTDYQILTSKVATANRAIDEAEDKAAAMHTESLVVRDAVAQMLISITGLSLSDGVVCNIHVSDFNGARALGDEEWKTILASGIGDTLYAACVYVQSVRGEQKKTCGSLVPSTSAPTTEHGGTVIDVVPRNGSFGVVTATRPPLSSDA